MAAITIYSKPACPYCDRAKLLFRQKGQTWTEINVQADPTQRAEMLAKAGGRTTVPQIFINGIHIGGCDDLYALDKKGELDSLLKN
ncbi:MAG: glutaredoxin 3 [Holosporales bacterium]|jgi:glutaredoxin 3